VECSKNKLTSLDLSNKVNLRELNCSENQLTSLDLRDNLAFEWLDCSKNKLNSLDLSKNIDLKWLHCNENQLTSLDISNCNNLTVLYCFINQLTSLDVSKDSTLEELYCSLNQLTGLNVSNNPALNYLHCTDNQLSSLNLKNNAYIGYLDAVNNPNLLCIEVRDSTKAAKNHGWHKDDWAIYSEDCRTVGVGEGIDVSNDITIFPNPASDYIDINIGEVILSCAKGLNIYNTMGECVFTLTPALSQREKEMRIDISGLAPGVYFVRVGGIVSKFIKL
jgi:hypothetical protein